MSLVSTPSLINGSIHNQQHGSLSSSADQKGDHGLSEGSVAQSGLGTEAEHFMNQHISTNSNNLAEVGENGDAAGGEDPPVVDIIINNVVCTFSTRCYLNLKKIAMEGTHVEYRRENGMLNMKLRRPNVTATIWSSGKVTCTGASSEDEAKLGARRVARNLQRLGFSVRFSSYRVVNVLGTCSLPFGIKLIQFSESHRECASYEPELHPGVTYRIKDPKATLKIFSTGSITVTAPSVLNVQLAIEHIYPLVSQHKMERVRVDEKVVVSENKYVGKKTVYVGYPVLHFRGEYDSDEDDDDEMDDDDDDSFDSDESQD